MKIGSVLGSGAILLALAGAGWGAEISADQRTEFRRLIAERDRVHEQLRELDRRAADQIKQGRDPVTLHSRQITKEDRLDLLQLRLEMMAARYGLEVPPLPGEAGGEQEASSAERGDDHRGAFQRGRGRAVAELSGQGRQLLASLDFSRFLGRE